MEYSIWFDIYRLACIFSFFGEDIAESSEIKGKLKSENFFSDNC